MIRSPLLWSGSKYDLLPEILPRITGRLWEPFCGSAVVSLNYQGESVISDRNPRLMNFWSQVKQQPEVFSRLRHALTGENHYYEVRKSFNAHSAQEFICLEFLYLNRTCWRGLYRENAKGEFNVPWGARKRVEWPEMPDMSRIYVYSARDYDDNFEGYDITEDSEIDTIYCDPPYVGTHSYGVKFDHNRFAAWCNRRTERVLVSNSPAAVKLFPGWHVTELSAKGGIGKRRAEVLLWNGR